jgi:hypothetical protein
MQRTEKPLSRGRRLTVRIVAMLGLLLFGFFFSIVALNTLGVVPSGAEGSPDDPPPSAEARFGAAHPGDAIHAVGAVAVVVIGASGLIAMIVRPERPGPAYQVLAAMTGVLLTLPIVGDPDNIGGQAGKIDPFLLLVVVPAVVAALLAAPWRRRGSDDRWRTRLLALAAIGAIPAAWYGVDQALFQRNTFPPTADPHHNAHWWAMAIIAFHGDFRDGRSGATRPPLAARGDRRRSGRRRPRRRLTRGGFRGLGCSDLWRRCRYRLGPRRAVAERARR